MEIVGAFTAWLGASLVLLADGRRGLAAGMALATLGLAAACLSAQGPFAAAVIFAGGAVAAVRRTTVGGPGWAIMPPGSTPRLVTCVAGGLLALWIGLAVTTGDGGALRFAAMAAIGLAGARVLWSDDPAVVLTAVAVMALGIAAATSLALDSPGVWPFAVAGVVAAGTAVIQSRSPRAA
ncbi:MAG TPA: hypothetical protein VJR46_01075 [Candidatus Dormibacteraeota bacterium]|nr:hypothetical protein [Candidatus Dormibacteraeota bacterium]